MVKEQHAGSGLAVHRAAVRYGEFTAVDGVDLDVAGGEVLALLGPSGSGKSSLLRAIAGLEPLAGGRLSWNGEDVSDVPVHRRGFGLLFQDGQLFPHRSVAGNLAYGLSDLNRRERRERVAELLTLVGLDGYGDRPVASLSGGQAQRVALARALAPSPRLLLLDEPLSALDRGLRERLTGELHRILRATGITAVYVTHDHDEAFTVADRVAVLIDGRLVQAGTPAQLWQAPQSREIAEFLGYGPFVTAAELRALAGSEPLPGVAGAEHRAGLDADSEPGSQPPLFALAPGAVQVDPTSDRAAHSGARGLEVIATRFVRGRLEIDVALPGGQQATAVAAEGAPGSLEPGEFVPIRVRPGGVVAL